MHLTLFVPGLCAPWQGAEAALSALHTPFLRKFLARANRVNVPALASFEDGLTRVLGVPEAVLPWAALECLGENGACAQGFVLRLDPVHFRLGMTEAIVLGGRSLHLRMDEANTLARALEQHFSARGWRIVVAAPQRWYLHLPESSDIVNVPLAQAFGRDAGLFKPQGKDAARWLADLTEAQMVLFAHPLNQAREAQGLPIINSVWPWGAGELIGNECAAARQGYDQASTVLPPSPLTGEGLGERVEVFATEHPAQSLLPPLPNPPPRGGRELLPLAQWTEIYANHPLARGLALAAGLPVYDLAETLKECADLRGNALIVLDDLLQPMQDGDLDDWQATLEGLEARWFAPLWAALARNQISGLSLDCGSAARFEFKPAHRFRLWRRELSLEQSCAVRV